MVGEGKEEVHTAGAVLNIQKNMRSACLVIHLDLETLSNPLVTCTTYIHASFL